MSNDIISDNLGESGVLPGIGTPSNLSSVLVFSFFSIFSNVTGAASAKDIPLVTIASLK